VALDGGEKFGFEEVERQVKSRGTLNNKLALERSLQLGISEELAKLDEKHAGVNFTKSKGGRQVLNVEVYSDRSKGHRLPLCRGRTMLLDRPLPHGLRIDFLT